MPAVDVTLLALVPRRRRPRRVVRLLLLRSQIRRSLTGFPSCGPPKIFSDRGLVIDVNDNEYAPSRNDAHLKGEAWRKKELGNVSPTNNLNCRIIGFNRNLHTGKTNLGGGTYVMCRKDINYLFLC